MSLLHHILVFTIVNVLIYMLYLNVNAKGEHVRVRKAAKYVSAFDFSLHVIAVFVSFILYMVVITYYGFLKVYPYYRDPDVYTYVEDAIKIIRSAHYDYSLLCEDSYYRGFPQHVLTIVFLSLLTDVSPQIISYVLPLVVSALAWFTLYLLLRRVELSRMLRSILTTIIILSNIRLLDILLNGLPFSQCVVLFMILMYLLVYFQNIMSVSIYVVLILLILAMLRHAVLYLVVLPSMTVSVLLIKLADKFGYYRRECQTINTMIVVSAIISTVYLLFGIPGETIVGRIDVLITYIKNTLSNPSIRISSYVSQGLGHMHGHSIRWDYYPLAFWISTLLIALGLVVHKLSTMLIDRFRLGKYSRKNNVSFAILLPIIIIVLNANMFLSVIMYASAMILHRGNVGMYFNIYSLSLAPLALIYILVTYNSRRLFSRYFLYSNIAVGALLNLFISPFLNIVYRP